MSKRKRWFLFLVAIVILVVSNIPLVSVLIGVFTNTEALKGEHPAFSSNLGGFRVDGTSIAGSSDQAKYNNLLKEFDAYKATHPNDTILYRHFGIHPLRFWMWYRYWLNRDNPYLQIPYKDPPANT